MATVDHILCIVWSLTPGWNFHLVMPESVAPQYDRTLQEIEQTLSMVQRLSHSRTPHSGWSVTPVLKLRDTFTGAEIHYTGYRPFRDFLEDNGVRLSVYRAVPPDLTAAITKVLTDNLPPGRRFYFQYHVE